MFAGRPADHRLERDPIAHHRAAHEDMVLPVDLAAEVDEKLRALLQRAILRDHSQRLQSAAAFRDGLKDWLTPVPDGRAQGGQAARSTSAAQMRHKS